MTTKSEFVTRAELHAILREFLNIDTELETYTLRALTEACSTSGNKLDFRGLEPYFIEENTTAVSSTVRQFVMAGKRRTAIRQKLGALVQALEPPKVVEVVKPEAAPVETKARLAAALGAKVA
jgi:hypothetical protein